MTSPIFSWAREKYLNADQLWPRLIYLWPPWFVRNSWPLALPSFLTSYDLAPQNRGLTQPSPGPLTRSRYASGQQTTLSDPRLTSPSSSLIHVFKKKRIVQNFMKNLFSRKLVFHKISHYQYLNCPARALNHHVSNIYQFLHLKSRQYWEHLVGEREGVRFSGISCRHYKWMVRKQEIYDVIYPEKSSPSPSSWYSSKFLEITVGFQRFQLF